MAAPLPLPCGSYSTPDPRSSVRRLVNCFAQMAPIALQQSLVPSDSKQTQPPITLRRAAGMTQFATDGSGNPCRGMWLMQGVLYAVIGPKLYSVSSTGALTQLGTGIPGTGIVRMTDNTQTLVVLVPGTSTGVTAYCYNTTNGYGTVALMAAAIDCWFIDSYVVFLQANGRGFFNSDAQPETVGNWLSFVGGAQFLREFGTDLFVGMGIDHRYITILGTGTGEMFIDAGNAVGSPFSDAPNNFIELGCYPGAGFTVAKQDQTIFWLANDLTVRRRSGETPLRVSNHGIEDILNTAAINNQLSGAYALTFSYSGHLFYALTLPLAGRTLVFDVTTSEWHELSSYNIGYWRPMCALNAYGYQLVGDSQGSGIGYLDITNFTEFGTQQVVSWIHQPVYQNNRRVSHKRLEIMLGAGLEPTLGYSPQLMLSMSNNGGITWRALPTRSLGTTGQYNNRAFWTQLGTSRQRVYQFSLSDGLSTWVTDASLDAAVGQ